MKNRHYKILLIDDDEDEFLIFKDLIDDAEIDADVEWAGNYQKGLEQLRQSNHDVYFVDYLLGAKTGFDLFQEANDGSFHQPVILLTGQGNREIDMMALENGLADYLTKDNLTPEILDRSLRYAINRYELERSTKQEKWRYNSLFNHSTDPILLCDLNFEVYECNRAFREFIGQEISNTERILLDSFIDDEEVLQDFKRILGEKSTFKDFDLQIDSVNGTLDCLASAVTIQDQTEEVAGYQVIFHDMTQVRAAEREIKIAEQTTFAGKLAQLIAHEVRNPLTNINLSVDQLSSLENPSKEDRALYFDMIKRNAHRINELISQILDSSKPANIKLEPVFIEELINDAIEYCHDRLQLNEVKLDLQISNSKEEIQVDQSKMALALANVITNAAEAMSETDHPTLTILCHSNDGQTYLEITDNGAGMTDEQRKKVFEPFFSSRRGGKGLGMTLTRNVISAHKGSITVESKLNEGTRIVIVLPQQS